MSFEVLLKLKAPFIKGEAHDFTNQVFERDLDLSNLTIGNVDFTGSHFKGRVTGVNAIFLGMAWFKDCIFEKDVSFTHTLFHADASFNKSRFNASFSLKNTEIRGTTRLDYAVFVENATFDTLEAYGNISLHHAQFLNGLTMRDIQAFGGLWIEGDDPIMSKFKALEVHGRTLIRSEISAQSIAAIDSYGLKQLQAK